MIEIETEEGMDLVLLLLYELDEGRGMATARHRDTCETVVRVINSISQGGRSIKKQHEPLTFAVTSQPASFACVGV